MESTGVAHDFLARAPYTLIVTRRVFPLLLISAAAIFAAQQKRPERKPPAGTEAIEQEPPEEDPDLKPTEYAFNPFEATRNITAGNFYYKKGNFHAASKRYLEATKWDPNSAEAFLKLGESYEKLRDFKGAREAYTKYIALTEDPKATEPVKKKVARLPADKTTK